MIYLVGENVYVFSEETCRMIDKYLGRITTINKALSPMVYLFHSDKILEIAKKEPYLIEQALDVIMELNKLKKPKELSDLVKEK